MRSLALVLLFACLLQAPPLRAQQAPLPGQTPEAEQPSLIDPAQPPLVDPAQPPLADPAQPPAAAPGGVAAPSGLPDPLDSGPNFSEADPNAVIASLARLYNRGRDRAFFGLPPNEVWRAPGPIRIALYSDQRDSQVSLVRATAAAFAEASGLPVDLATARPLSAVASAEAVRQATGANLEILVGPRAVMAQLAGALAVNQTMLFRFEDGRWPFAFTFPREPQWVGRVMIASDEPAEAIEASLILAVVWALGGVSLGSEMQGLIDPLSYEPALTPLGQSVFGLMYHPQMESGLPVPEALLRARVLLGL